MINFRKINEPVNESLSDVFQKVQKKMKFKNIQGIVSLSELLAGKENIKLRIFGDTKSNQENNTEKPEIPNSLSNKTTKTNMEIETSPFMNGCIIMKSRIEIE